VETFLINERIVNDSLAGGEKWFQESMDRRGPGGITDTVEVLSRWYSYQERVPPSKSDADNLPKWSEDTWTPPVRSASTYEPPRYIEPVQTIRNTEPRVGRNDPCPCGSGKKYKKCCGKP
jgi:hypothetical protein